MIYRGLKLLVTPLDPLLAQYRLALVALVVGVVALAVGVPGACMAVNSYFSRVGEQVASVNEQVASVKQALVAKDFRITSPAEGDLVTQTNRVEGTTQFPHRNHYLVVTPHTIGTRFVEPNPVLVDPWGKWVGVAQFGTAGAGRDQLFVVQALATKATLAPGRLIEAPPDAVYSQAVTVVRKN